MAASCCTSVTTSAHPCARPTDARSLAARACRLCCMVLSPTARRLRADACRRGARHSGARAPRSQPGRLRRQHVPALLQQRSRQCACFCGRTGVASPRPLVVDERSTEGCRACWLAVARLAAMAQLSSGLASRLCRVTRVTLWRHERASASVHERCTGTGKIARAVRSATISCLCASANSLCQLATSIVDPILFGKRGLRSFRII